jgi:hypothetical protein
MALGHAFELAYQIVVDALPCRVFVHSVEGYGIFANISHFAYTSLRVAM